MPKGIRLGGRQKGVPNKRTLDLQAILAKHGCNPAEGLAIMCADPKTPQQLRANIQMELMGYVYPKRKAVEHSGLDGLAIQTNVTIDLRDPAIARASRDLARTLAVRRGGNGGDVVEIALESEAASGDPE